MANAMTAESLDGLVARLQKRAQQLYDGWKVRTDDTIAAIANELSESAEQIVALRARAEEAERNLLDVVSVAIEVRQRGASPLHLDAAIARIVSRVRKEPTHG